MCSDLCAKLFILNFQNFEFSLKKIITNNREILLLYAYICTGIHLLLNCVRCLPSHQCDTYMVLVTKSRDDLTLQEFIVTA